ncbi:Adaptor protein complex AP-1 gamma subunit [Rhizoclosmatium globosum]|uniref:AP-1 complex subunit gamma n=1 Tax=Rhizoclosmatium globosum TaxID=329046 RepID=A0A1Y2CTQ8_9FUNG|nr:Adaptor protein complex AP-1 gamma subunit [Rhizoclosmatium globosum]|eukprot:ORY50440.1 Adaptor protein complex AP-1 gamma subunit [Rhizoclosmatium globosum]
MDKLINKLVVTKLKDMIKAIRAAKTAADERAVIAKESAFIRTAIKEETIETRYINVQKLLYIHMLGYPAHFGQIECLKLVASPKYADKRLGYLGIMLLMDENQETLTLVTNCLQNDMNNSNVFIAGLALTTLGNISSPEMARDLCADVEKMLGSPNAYIRKKAALCAIRIIKKVPDLIENFLEKAKDMLRESNESSLLTGISLEIEMSKLNPDYVIPQLKEQVPALVKRLKNLITTGFSPEHDVGGVTDPFLQTKILRLLRILGANDPRSSELMNDVLSQVATTTESSKNVGNAVLYEAVLTIMGIEAEHAVKVLAINILGKFLSNPDNNIRYVALTTLTRTYHSSLLTAGEGNTTSLQRHRATILACLRDDDSTLRAKALDLSFHLITPSTVSALMKDLLSYLEINPDIGHDARSSLGKRIVDHAARFRVSKVWEMLVNLRVLLLAGDARGIDAVVYNFVKLVSVASEELQVTAARRLFWSVAKGGELVGIKEGFVLAMCWSCGEFGDLVVDSGFVTASVEDGDFGGSEVPGGAAAHFGTAPSEREVVELLETLLKGHFATAVVKAYAVTALVKLSARFGDDAVLEQINQLIAKHQVNMDVEIQARAVEFNAISGLELEVKSGLLERMPVLEVAVKEEEVKGTGETLVAESLRNSTSSMNASEPKQATPAPKPEVSAVQDLLGLDLNFDLGSTPIAPVAPSVSQL